MKYIYSIMIVLLLVGCETNDFEKQNGIREERTISELVMSYMRNKACDQTLIKYTEESSLEICYSYKNKSPFYVGYDLSPYYIDEVNIKERPYFTEDEDIPEEYRTKYSDYTGSGYDRGHMAPDADFDYKEEDLKQTYILSNIVLQNSEVNQRKWILAEERERELTRVEEYIKVINIIVYSEEEYNGIHIPKGMYKIIYNGIQGECYYFENKETEKNNLSEFSVSCEEALIELGA
jgi:endonuclease G